MLEAKVFIKEFENHDFYFYDTNWWPLIKVQVAYQLQLKNAGTFNKTQIKSSYLNEILKLTFKEKIKYFLQLFRSSLSADNLIVTDFCKTSVNKDNLKNLANPYTDTFIHYFNEFEIDYFLYHVGLDKTLFGFDIPLLKKKYSKSILSKFEEDIKFKTQLRKLSQFLTETYGEDFELYDFLVRTILSNQEYYIVFLLILKNAKVKKIVLYCYYNNFMMSIIRAANKLNITTIEYQHSQVTSNHFAYSNWNSKLQGGQVFFPSKIWVWRKKDADYLQNQFRKVKDIKFVVGGNLAIALSTIKREEKANSKVKVLITLQGNGIPDYIVNQLESQSDLIFYLRLHPRYPKDKEFCERLQLKHKSQIELEMSNSKSLYELFAQVDYHLTCFSGSAIEAKYFNLTNIIFGEKGYVTFQEEIEKGEFLFVSNQQEFDAILKNRIKTDCNEESTDINLCQLFEDNFN